LTQDVDPAKLDDSLERLLELSVIAIQQRKKLIRIWQERKRRESGL